MSVGTPVCYSVSSSDSDHRQIQVGRTGSGKVWHTCLKIGGDTDDETRVRCSCPC